MKKTLIIFLSFILLLNFSGCSRTPPHSFDGMAELNVKEENINNKIELSYPPKLNSFKNDDDLTLYIDNLSDDPIAVKSDFGVRIFVYDHKKWIEIENQMEYTEKSSSLQVFPPSKGDPFKVAAVSFWPYYSTIKKKTPCRIIVSGQVMNGEIITEELTYSYIDITLKP